MNPAWALLRLASPQLPIGGYSYSQGLEMAVDNGRVNNPDSARRWIRSSRTPLENHGSALSDERGSKNTLGWFAPLSTAGQPYSVKRIGFAIGTQAVGSACRSPSIRS